MTDKFEKDPVKRFLKDATHGVKKRWRKRAQLKRRIERNPGHEDWLRENYGVKMTRDPDQDQEPRDVRPEDFVNPPSSLWPPPECED